MIEPNKTKYEIKVIPTLITLCTVIALLAIYATIDMQLFLLTCISVMIYITGYVHGKEANDNKNNNAAR